MFNIRSFIDGFVIDILNIPIAYVQSHYFIIKNGIIGCYRIELSLPDPNMPYLKLRPMAVLNIIIMASVANSIDKEGKFLDQFVSSFFKPDSIVDTFFTASIVFLISFYVCSYFVCMVFRGGRHRSVLFASISIYYASTIMMIFSCLALYLFLNSLSIFSLKSQEYFLRFVSIFGHAWAFFFIGLALANLVSPKTVYLPIVPKVVASASLCFLVYFRLLSVLFEIDLYGLFWPSLGM